MIKVLHINTVYGRAGAALSMAQLSECLGKQDDFQSDMLVGRICSEEKPCNVIALGGIYEYLINCMITRITGLDSIWYPINHQAKLEKLISKYDIIHLHNLHGYYFQIKYLELLKDKKVIWSIRDYWPLTGKCTFPLECKKWIAGCGKCNHLDYYPKSDLFDVTQYNHSIKEKYIEMIKNLNLVAISNTVKMNVLNRNINFKSINVIYNGLDPNLYQPIESGQSIVKDNSKNKILLVASKFNKRKGVELLTEMFSCFSAEERKKYFIMVIGGADRTLVKNLLKGFAYANYGYVTDINILTQAYSSADLFLNLSLSETFGRTTIESMLCGTPVIGLDTDIMREIINDKNLLVSLSGNIGENAYKKIKKFFDGDNSRDRYRTGNVRNNAKKYSINTMVANYVELYKNIMKGS